MTTQALSSSSLVGDSVKNRQDEDLGTVKEIMIDLESGAVAYVVMASGGVLGMGDNYFAIPWSMIDVDLEAECLVIDAAKDTFEDAPGFDKDNWPETSSVSRLEHY